MLYGYEDEMTFKQYFTDLFQVTLKALNKNYSDLVLNRGDGCFLATAVYAEINLIKIQALAQLICRQIVTKVVCPSITNLGQKEAHQSGPFYRSGRSGPELIELV